MRKWIFRIAALLLLIALAGAMMIIGRGHTIYFDNKTIEYDGQTYKALNKVTVFVEGEQVAKLSARERGMAECMGQNFSFDLTIVENKDGEEVSKTVNVKLPYSLDGIVLNLPALLAGLPEEAYMSEFVSLLDETAEEIEEDDISDDGMSTGDIF